MTSLPHHRSHRRFAGLSAVFVIRRSHDSVGHPRLGDAVPAPQYPGSVVQAGDLFVNIGNAVPKGTVDGGASRLLVVVRHVRNLRRTCVPFVCPLVSMSL